MAVPWTLEKLAEVVKVTAMGRGIMFTKFETTDVEKMPPQRLVKGRANPERHSRIYAEIDGGDAIGRFRIGLEEVGSMDLPYLQKMLIRRLDDAQWESNPNTN